MKNVYKKKDSFLEKSFLSSANESFIEKIQNLRNNEIYIKNLSNYNYLINTVSFSSVLMPAEGTINKF